MQFIGRKKTMQRLESLYVNHEAFVLMTGRKNVGKTTLLRAFAQNKKVLYYSCGNVSDTLNRHAFHRALIEYNEGMPVFKDHQLPSWKEMFMALARFQQKERKVLIIDNFHYLAQENPEVLSVLKSVWNNTFRSNFVMVVLSVPHGRMLLNLQDKGSNLLSAVTHRLRLEPISFIEMMHEYPHHDFKQLLMLYSIVGGVPKYWGYFKDSTDTEEFITAVSDYCLNPFGALLDEPIKLLEGEVSNLAEFHSVLFAIANGRRTIHDVEAFTGYKRNLLETIIGKCEDLHLVEKVSYIAEHKSILVKPTVKYEISDPYTAFWYTFVFPYYEEIRESNDELACENLRNHFQSYVQHWFSKIARKILISASQKGTVPIQCSMVGSFADTNGEIDIVAIDETNKKIFFGDCCYDQQPYALARFNLFVDRCNGLKGLKRYKDYKVLYGVFSVYPFEQDLMDCALINKDILLFNGINMYSMNL